MNKKAWIGILTVIFIGITISVIVYAYYKPYETSVVMGKQQSAIMEAYSVGEQARRFSSDAANLAAQQALYRLANNGGHYEIPSTCNAEGHLLIGGTCSHPSDEEVTENFEALFEDEFYKYLSGFKLPIYKEDEEERDVTTISLGEEDETEIPRNLSDVVYNFNIEIENKKIIIEGFPDIKIHSYIVKVEEKEFDENETDTITRSAIEEYNTLIGQEIGEVTEISESLIIISSEKYSFEYSVDPYFKTELDIDLKKIHSDAKSSDASNTSSENYKFYNFNSGKKVLVKKGQEDLVWKFAKAK